MLCVPHCRSTVLDTWNDAQVRGMKLGGNAAAGLALGVKVGTSGGISSKYTSRAAVDYKNALANKVKIDQQLSPDDAFATVEITNEAFKSLEQQSEAIAEERKVVEAKLISLSLSSEKAFEGLDEVDKFEDAEEAAKSIPVAKPIFLDSSSSTQKPPPMKPAGKVSKLGAVRSTGIDFNKIELQLKEEKEQQEEIALVQQQQQKKKEEEEKMAQKKAITEPNRPSSANHLQKGPQAPPPLTKDQEAAMGRLGMGMKKMNLQQLQQQPQPQQISSSNLASQPVLPPQATKSISSEQYFKQDGKSEEEKKMMEEQLLKVRGQKSISSSDFFGNNKEESESEIRSSGGRRLFPSFCV